MAGSGSGLVEDLDEKGERDPELSKDRTASGRWAIPEELRGLFVVLFLEIYGAGLAIPVFQYFCIVQLGLNGTYFGIIASCFHAAQLVGAPIVGRLSDAFGRRLTLLLCFVWTSVCFLATAGVTSFAQMLFVRTCAGLSGGSIPITQAIVMDASAPDERPQLLGIMGGVLGVAFTLGPASSSIALVLWDFSRRWVFVVAAVFAMIGCIVGALVLKETLPQSKRRPLNVCVGRQEDEERQTDFSSGKGSGLIAAAAEIRGVWSPAMGCIWIARSCCTFVMLCLFVTYPFLVRDAFNWSDAQFGAVLALGGIVAAFSQAVIYPSVSNSCGKHTVCVIGSAFFTAYFILMPHVTLVRHNIIGHLAVQTLFCVGLALMDSGLPDLVGLYAPEDRMGFAQGMTSGFRALAAVVSPLVAGRIYDDSPFVVYLIASCLAAVGGLAVSCAPLLSSTRTQGEVGHDETSKLIPK